jgi:hypothetical protein
MINIKFKKLDDEMHFWAGMLISIFSFILYTFLFSEWVSGLFAFATAALAGVGKELYDKHVKKTYFNSRDLKWTLIGGAIVPFIFIIGSIIYYYSKP